VRFPFHNPLPAYILAVLGGLSTPEGAGGATPAPALTAALGAGLGAGVGYLFMDVPLPYRVSMLVVGIWLVVVILGGAVIWDFRQAWCHFTPIYRSGRTH